MNNNAKLWVEALRSGKFKQGAHALCKNDRYCCLGVACQLYCENVKNILTEKMPGVEQQLRIENGYKYYDEDSETLPKVVREWLGVKTNLGAFKTTHSIGIPDHLNFGQECMLTRLNDNGMTFKEIANIIEQEPEGLFVTEAPVTL